MKSKILNILLIEGPFRGRHVSIPSTFADTGRAILLPDIPALRLGDLAPKVRPEGPRVHRYRAAFTAKTGWVGLYEGSG